MSRVLYDRNRFVADRIHAGWPDGSADARTFHRTLPGYAPTPLRAMPALAAEVGVKRVWVKDESSRFGLNSFKVLGASYAIHRFLEKAAPLRWFTLATATDGNHGRAVAWAARRLGQKATIFVPQNTTPARIAAIRGEGAEVVVVDGNYDDAVKRAAADAERNGWHVISDTAYEGYVEIPGWIMDGYSTLFTESFEELASLGEARPSLVFLQAGVGGLAAAGVRSSWRWTKRPKLVVVEPTDADCLRESIASPDGSMRQAKGKLDSIMAGLNCGTPSLLAWPVLRSGVDGFLAIDDAFAEDAMRRLAAGKAGDAKIVAGESGAAGLAGLLAIARERDLEGARQDLGAGPDCSVLVINTEGATDPENYQRIVRGKP